MFKTMLLRNFIPSIVMVTFIFNSVFKAILMKVLHANDMVQTAFILTGQGELLIDG